jgi:hypothetical protein
MTALVGVSPTARNIAFGFMALIAVVVRTVAIVNVTAIMNQGGAYGTARR